MKETELIKIKKENESMKAVINYLLQETTQLKEFSIGTLKLLQKFSEYDDAVEKLKSEAVKLEEEPKPKKAKKKLE